MSNTRSVFCLYDLVSEDFGPVFEAKTFGAALRMLKQYFDTQKGLSVKDYKLVKLFELHEDEGYSHYKHFDLSEFILAPGQYEEEVK